MLIAALQRRYIETVPILKTRIVALERLSMTDVSSSLLALFTNRLTLRFSLYVWVVIRFAFYCKQFTFYMIEMWQTIPVLPILFIFQKSTWQVNKTSKTNNKIHQFDFNYNYNNSSIKISKPQNDKRNYMISIYIVAMLMNCALGHSTKTDQ